MGESRCTASALQRLTRGLLCDAVSDLYKTLRIQPGVTKSEVRKAFKQLDLQVSLILRGANNFVLDEMVMQFVVGGGAVEAALSVYLENLATTFGSREHSAGDCGVLKVLAIEDATKLVANIRAYHHIVQTKANKKPGKIVEVRRFTNLDVEECAGKL